MMPHKNKTQKRAAQRASYRRLLVEQPWRTMFLASRRRARERGIRFELTLEWFAKRWTGFCEMTDMPFKLGSGTHNPYAPSVDRIRNGEGYTQDNCRIILTCINTFKGTMTDKQMREVARKML